MSGVKTKFYKAFTLAELMVILAVMTVVIAAVAPILTSKYNTLMSSEVWHDVPADDEGDIYTDGINHFSLQEIMIGLSPLDLEDIRTNYKPYAKLNIRTSQKVNGDIVQNPIEFYYKGNKKGYLAAGNENIMLVGDYDSMIAGDVENGVDGAINNTAYGYKALNSITGGIGNTAIGYNSLSALTTGRYNTAIGTSAGSTSNGIGNVYIGYSANANGDYNTIVSNNTAVSANRTTAIGENVSFAGNNNVAIGEYADGSGNNNTVVGAYAGSQLSLNSNKTSSRTGITAIGAMSCANLGTSAGYKTCIGQGGSYTSVNDTTNQVFIGRGIDTYSSPAAVVVNSTGANSSVVVYGNLIVRGQTYMYGKSPFPLSSSKGDALMGYTLYREATRSSGHTPYVGFDGSGQAIQVRGKDGASGKDNNGYWHQVYGGKEACICTYSGSNTYSYLQNDSGANVYSSPGTQAYDWSADFIFPNVTDTENREGYTFTGDSGSSNIELSRAHSVFNFTGERSGSCCPILTTSGNRGKLSDARLKNVNGKFISGLKDLEKINAYNFTFKNDKSKLPWVGVIAQNLKYVFPNAVTKGQDGYYKIRWDEMFYSAINSIKELNTKITSLVSKVQNDFERIAKLKKENKKLENKLIKLAEEIEKLEQNK